MTSADRTSAAQNDNGARKRTIQLSFLGSTALRIAAVQARHAAVQ